MKKLVSFAAPVTVALILGLAVYAVPATGTSTSLAGRVAKLEAANKKLTAANKKVSAATAKLTAANVKLTKRVADLEAFTSCNQQAAPVSRKGDPTTGSGFEYTPDNKVTVTLFRGLIPTPTGDAPDAYLQLVDAKCISGAPARAGLLAQRSH